ncbi:uncharacterized protein CDV56_100297 [Aspergillus thermomutatus]|uniref:Alcohol dehydrogenase-like C-terminal domain-containing protein n=1 Tax=Aspergillus thermomutatus TaxID=41047 RepID=A0A397FXK3_ASPTH|nr:uncharacterized protein CDV56_100297 [Aspergillus thermomutatus]RHZ43395.1 hypothetical protein CDV56_100297 [Aspergillus thermomutatus]
MDFTLKSRGYHEPVPFKADTTPKMVRGTCQANGATVAVDIVICESSDIKETVHAVGDGDVADTQDDAENASTAVADASSFVRTSSLMGMPCCCRRTGSSQDATRSMLLMYISVFRGQASASAILDKLHNDNSYEFVFVVEATGDAKFLEGSTNLVRKGGKLVVYGVCNDNDRTSLSPKKIFIDEISVQDHLGI